MPDLRAQLQSTFGSRYTLERELTGGGMSHAWVAAETALGRRVVVKVLDPELAASMSLERFAREIQLTAGLQHPNIVPVLSAGDSAGLPYYTMPFIEGASLRNRLDRGRMPAAESLPVLRDVARALAYAHEHGVVHRDIKPDNVLLSEGAGVVTDFGIAKAISASRTRGDMSGTSLTVAGTSLGTPAYLAPEQALGDAVDARSDIYAWGVVAYEALAGMHPFHGKHSAQQLVAAHIAERPAPLATHAPDLSPEVASLVDRCLEKDPSLRPQTARELVAALDAAAVSGVRGRATPRRRRPAVAVAGAGIAMLVALALVFQPDFRARFTPGGAQGAGDAGVIAVFPFRVTAADPATHYLREGMLDLIGAQLVGTPRTVDTRSTLAAWRRAGGSESVDLEAADAARVAASLGAGRVIQGDVLAHGGRLTITASMLTAPQAEERARATASGDPAALPVLMDSIITRLLAIDAGEGEQRAASLASIPLPALQAYLAGQAAHRRGDYPVATELLSRAVENDSTFALAGMALQQVATWIADPRAERGLAIAHANRDRLGVRDQLVLDAMEATRRFSTESEVLAEYERVVAAAPDVPELWYELGDRHFHFGASAVGAPVAMRRAAAAFERVLELDPTFTPALEHLPLIYAQLGDSVNLRAAYDRLAKDTSAYFYLPNRLSFAPRAEDRADALRMLAHSPPAPVNTAMSNAVHSGAGMEHLPHLLELVQARTGSRLERRIAALVSYRYYSDAGQPAAAARIAARTPEIQPHLMMAATWWGGDSAAGAAQHARAAARPRRPARIRRGRAAGVDHGSVRPRAVRARTRRHHQHVPDHCGTPRRAAGGATRRTGRRCGTSSA